MKLKKLGYMNVKEEDALTRSEMQSILAGSGGGSGGDNSSTNCILCYGATHEPSRFFEQPYHGQDPNQFCRTRGPYPSGTWGQCY